MRPGRFDEYQRLHNPIPRELASILEQHGVCNYSIFHHPRTNVMFGYMEIESEDKFNKIGDYECFHQWWKLMTENLVTVNSDDTKAREEPMVEIFHM